MICENFPMTCKGGNEENGLFGSAGKMAVPGFNVVKSAYDKICANLKVLEQSPAFKNGSPNTMKLYQKLVKQKEVFLQAIKDHPGYEDFVQKREKQREDDAQKNKSMKQLSEGELEEFRLKWKKMSSPRKVAYLGALAIINRALASLTEDKYCANIQQKKDSSNSSWFTEINSVESSQNFHQFQVNLSSAFALNRAVKKSLRRGKFSIKISEEIFRENCWLILMPFQSAQVSLKLNLLTIRLRNIKNSFHQLK